MNPDTRTDRFIKNIKNHPVISFLIIGGIVIVALGAVAGGMDNIVSLWNKLVHKHPESSVPLQDIMDTSIVSATATVEVTITSDRSGVKNHIMPGTYVAFAKDGQALLVMSSMTCRSEQKGNNSVLYSSTLSMEPGNEAFDKPLSFFKQTDYIQVCLKPIPARSRILSGRVVCVFNDVIPLEIQIPSQEMVSDVIAIRDIGMALEMQLKAQPNR